MKHSLPQVAGYQPSGTPPRGGVLNPQGINNRPIHNIWSRFGFEKFCSDTMLQKSDFQKNAENKGNLRRAEDEQVPQTQPP